MSASSCRRLRQPRVTYRGWGEGGDSRSVFKECVRGCVLEGVYEIGVQEKRAGTVPLPPADSAALMPWFAHQSTTAISRVSASDNVQNKVENRRLCMLTCPTGGNIHHVHRNNTDDRHPTKTALPQLFRATDIPRSRRWRMSQTPNDNGTITVLLCDKAIRIYNIKGYRVITFLSFRIWIERSWWHCVSTARPSSVICDRSKSLIVRLSRVGANRAMTDTSASPKVGQFK